MRRLAFALSVCVLLAQGCSLGPREDWAQAIRKAYEEAERIGAAEVRQSVTVEVIETTIRQTPQPLVARSSGVADFSAHRAQMVETAKRKAQLVYDDLVVYAQRSTSSIGTGKKRWARFDFEQEPDVDLDDNDRRLSVGAAVISPVLALELLDGLLTGSMEKHGTGMKTGVETTRYTGRLAPDAAVNEVRDEDRKEGVARLFETLGVEQDDFPVDVWLDAQGRIRGVRFVMRQQKDRVNAFTLTSSWEFSGYGPSRKRVTVPDDGDTLRSGRFRDFVTEVIREFG